MSRPDVVALGADPLWRLWEPVVRAVGGRLWTAAAWTPVRTTRLGAVLVSSWQAPAPHCVRLARVWADRCLCRVDVWLVGDAADPGLCSQVLRAGGSGCLARTPHRAAAARLLALAAWGPSERARAGG